jgi:hypothetical protein
MAFFFGNVVKFQLLDQFAWEKEIKLSGLVAFSTKNRDDYLLYPYPSRPKEILRQSSSLNVYDYKQIGLDLQQKTDIQTSLPVPNSSFNGNIEINDYAHIRGWAVIPNLGSSSSKIYVLLKSNKITIKLKTYRSERQDVSSQLGIQYLYDYSGYDAYPAAYQIPSDNYELGVLIENDNQIALQWTEQKIFVP